MCKLYTGNYSPVLNKLPNTNSTQHTRRDGFPSAFSVAQHQIASACMAQASSIVIQKWPIWPAPNSGRSIYVELYINYLETLNLQALLLMWARKASTSYTFTHSHTLTYTYTKCPRNKKSDRVKLVCVHVIWQRMGKWVVRRKSKWGGLAYNINNIDGSIFYN